MSVIANIAIKMLGLHSLCTLLLMWNENVCLSSYIFVIKLLKLRKNLADSNLIIPKRLPFGLAFNNFTEPKNNNNSLISFIRYVS